MKKNLFAVFFALLLIGTSPAFAAGLSGKYQGAGEQYHEAYEFSGDHVTTYEFGIKKLEGKYVLTADRLTLKIPGYTDIEYMYKSDADGFQLGDPKEFGTNMTSWKTTTAYWWDGLSPNDYVGTWTDNQQKIEFFQDKGEVMLSIPARSEPDEYKQRKFFKCTFTQGRINEPCVSLSESNYFSPGFYLIDKTNSSLYNLSTNGNYIEAHEFAKTN